MALIPEAFLKAVVAIGRQINDEVAWIGTGFLYSSPVKESNPDSVFIYLITNRHVIDGQPEVILRFENSSGSSNQFTVQLLNGSVPIWTAHPDKAVDVAVFRLNPEVLKSSIGLINCFSSTSNTLEVSKASGQHLLEGDAIYLLGFPMSMVDAVENLPIVRGGTVARIRDCKARRSDKFLIDCQTFPGNSGGPVLIRPELASIAGTTAISSCHLLGIVAGYHTYRDVAVSRQTGREKIIFEENSGLSIVYPVEAINQAIKHFESSQPPASEANPKVADSLKDSNEVQATKPEQ